MQSAEVKKYYKLLNQNEMSRKNKNRSQEALNEKSINFYRVQGASCAFIEFLNQSNNYNEIFSMWQWLKIEFAEGGVEDRVIFSFFKNANEWGYDVRTLSSKLINALITVDLDEIEVGWLQSNFFHMLSSINNN